MHNYRCGFHEKCFENDVGMLFDNIMTTKKLSRIEAHLRSQTLFCCLFSFQVLVIKHFVTFLAAKQTSSTLFWTSCSQTKPFGRLFSTFWSQNARFGPLFLIVLVAKRKFWTPFSERFGFAPESAQEKQVQQLDDDKANLNKLNSATNATGTTVFFRF